MPSAVPAKPLATCTPHLPKTLPFPPRFSLFFLCALRPPPSTRRKAHLPSRAWASPLSPLTSRGCDPAPGESWARWGPAGAVQHRAPKLYGLGRISFNVPWEVITPICRSMNTAERRLGNRCLGMLPYLYLARCLTNGIQLKVPALRTRRTREPRAVDLSFFLSWRHWSQYSKLGAQRQALRPRFISSHQDVTHPGPSLTLSFFLYRIEITGTYNATIP